MARNVGEYDHGRLQGVLFAHLFHREKLWGIHVVPAQRVQVSRTRFRVPDVCVVAGAEPDEEIFTKPSFLCIEILSPEDTMSRMLERIDDYLSFGVAHVRVLDPRTRRAYAYTAAGMREARDGVLRTVQPPIAIPLAEIFNVS